MFTKLLIANRGEIACRVARTARRLGIRTVAIYSDADANAAHVAACDEAVRIEAAGPRESYLHADAIIQAAQQTGAEAIHPGYGFLSENADFAAACAKAGVVFVGPSAAAIAAMGSKSAAKALMEKAGVPLTPGYHGDEQDPDYLLGEARRIGFPVLIKAVAGGGGKGMRRVDRAEDFPAALTSCRREAAGSFRDDRVLLEKYVERARHIEMQVFGDAHGNAVYLFERDCSVQRRHQKVLEEAPAPGMTAERRAAMGAAAVAAARAVNYCGAGTVEFIASPEGAFYFMEMNTRLQVEHAVTEMITGLDLVEWQLRVASGEPLPLRQDQLSIRGHAFEARIYAEDPAREFLPSTGRIEYLRTPETSADLRIDTGVRQGDEITPYYDPMIAKLIVHGATRAEALTRLRTGLVAFELAGVRTNVEFLGRLTTSPSFVTAHLDTALIEREREHLFAPSPPPSPEAWARAARAFARGSSSHKPTNVTSPWNDSSGWRMVGSAGREVILACMAIQKNLRVEFGTMDRVTVDKHTVALAPEANAVLATGGVHVFEHGVHHVFTAADPYLPPTDIHERHGGLSAPMPGKVIAIAVKAGDKVPRGAALVVVEAMKMEHTITAPSSGTVESVLCNVGEQVKEGAELLVLSA